MELTPELAELVVFVSAFSGGMSCVFTLIGSLIADRLGRLFDKLQKKRKKP